VHPAAATRSAPTDTVVCVIDEAVIREAGRRLREAAPTAHIILFGSQARDEGDRHSDLDFLVIEPELENAAEESVRLRREVRDLLVPMDIVVVSARDVEEWRDVRGSLVHAALSDGRVLAA
jgi:uncharacterized protein